jgi:hypothetical protein
MPEMKSPSRCHGRSEAEGRAQRTMSHLSGGDPSGLRDLRRLLGPLIHAFFRK